MLRFRSFSICLLIALCALPAAAKKKGLQNAFYFEYGGNAILYSLNYDRILFKVGDRNFAGARIGFSWMPFNKQVLDIEHVFIVPMTLNYLYGIAPHYGELGLGVAVRTYTDPGIVKTTLFPCISLGYRARAKGSGTLFRIDFTPVFFKEFVPWFGFSLVRAF